MKDFINHPVMSVDEVLRPTHLEINLAHLKNNFTKIKQHVAPAKVMPILKQMRMDMDWLELLSFFRN